MNDYPFSDTIGGNMNNRGFTFLEIMAVITLIGILLGIALINYNDIRGGIALQQAAYRLSQDVRRMEEQAMATFRQEQCTQGSYKYGFGIYLEKDSNSYTLFADCNGNGKYEQQQGQAVDFEIATDLSDFNKVQISSIQNGNEEISSVSVVFEPPDPVVLFDPAADEVSVEISLPGNDSSRRRIMVNKAGLISLE